jgi:hypothetical protein
MFEKLTKETKHQTIENRFLIQVISFSLQKNYIFPLMWVDESQTRGGLCPRVFKSKKSIIMGLVLHTEGKAVPVTTFFWMMTAQAIARTSMHCHSDCFPQRLESCRIFRISFLGAHFAREPWNDGTHALSVIIFGTVD